MGKLKPVRRVYGKPWSKMSKIEVTPMVLQELGKILLEAIKEEADKEMRDSPSPAGKPETLPLSDRFIDSLSVSTRGHSTIVISTTWPWMDRLIEGRKPYPMKWLTREAGVSAVPIEQGDGSTALIATPATSSDAWIHPGVKKHKFIERGIEVGKKRAIPLLRRYVIQQVLQGDPTK